MAPIDDRTHIDAEAFGGVLEGQHFLVLRKRRHARETSFVRFSRKQRLLFGEERCNRRKTSLRLAPFYLTKLLGIRTVGSREWSRPRLRPRSPLSKINIRDQRARGTAFRSLSV